MLITAVCVLAGCVQVREYQGKRLLKAAMLRLFGIELPINVAQVKSDTNFIELLEKHPFLNQTKLVVKPDMLFGQRGKNDLVGLNLTYQEAEEFIKARQGKQVRLGVLLLQQHLLGLG